MAKYKFSRVTQRDKHRIHVNKTGVALLCILALGFFGLKGASKGSAVYKQHQANVRRIEKIQQFDTNHITCRIKTAPSSEIIVNGKAKGRANQQGIYDLSNVMLGSNVQSAYGPTKSDLLKLGRNARNKTMALKFDYLKGDSAQNLMDDVYKQVTLLANQGPDVENTLDSYYLHGAHNQAYQDMSQWCHDKYDDIRDTQKNSEKNEKSEGKFLSSVHFAVSVQSTTLNSDGTVTLKYNVKNYLDRESGTNVQTIKWTSHAKCINGTWYVIDSSASPVR